MSESPPGRWQRPPLTGNWDALERHARSRTPDELWERPIDRIPPPPAIQPDPDWIRMTTQTRSRPPVLAIVLGVIVAVLVVAAVMTAFVGPQP